MIMFTEITSTSDAVVRIAWTMGAVFVISIAFAWMTRRR